MKHARSFVLGVLFAVAAFIAAPKVVDLLRPGVAEAAQSQKAQAAEKTYKLHEAAFQSGTSSAEDVYVWSHRWMEAEGGAGAKRDHLARMTKLNTAVQRNVTAGIAKPTDAAAAAFYLAEAKELAGAP